jgi:CheY-like chemotaxis protein
MEGRGFAVWLADDGARAVELYREHREEIDLVLLDVQMPVMDGPQALAALQAIDPLVLACFMTAGTNSYTEESLLQRGAACVIRKPFHTPAVGDLLERLADRPRAVPALFSASAPRRWSPRRGRGLPPS